jgi:outer membrane protein TolC
MNKVALALAWLLVPSIASAQMSASEATEAALAAYPGYQAAAIEVRRSRDHVRAEEARYQLILHLEGNAQLGTQPALTSSGNIFGMNIQARTIFPYSERINLIAEVRRPFDTGTVVALRTTGYRLFAQSSFAGTSSIATTGPGYGLDVALTVTQPFLQGFGSDVGAADLHAARIDLHAQEAARDQRASDLISQVLTNYAELWYSQQGVQINTASRDRAERQRQDAQGRVEVGTLAPADALQFATQVATMEEAMALSEVDRRSRALALATLLAGAGSGAAGIGVASGMDTRVADLPIVSSPPSDTEAVQLAMSRSPQIAALLAQIEAARQAAQIATQAIMPRLDAQAQVAFHGLGLDDVGAAFQQVGTVAAVTALFSLIYETPLEDTRLHEEEERASLAIDSAEAQLAEARLTITQQVETLLQQRIAARRRIELAESTVDIAHRAVEAAQARVEIGSAQVTQLLDAQDQERQAQLRLARAQTDLVVADTSLAAQTGRLLDDVVLPE